MDRYSKITNKNQREIVLLKAFPCIWGKCRFCDYIEDNSNQKDEMIRLNHEILSQVTGEFGVLEVINSGSCFELPKETLEEILRLFCGFRFIWTVSGHFWHRRCLAQLEEFLPGWSAV